MLVDNPKEVKKNGEIYFKKLLNGQMVSEKIGFLFRMPLGRDKMMYVKKY